MAAFDTLLTKWGPIIVKNLPYIINAGVHLYDEYRILRRSNSEKKAVDDAMELIKENRNDIDRLMQDRKQMMAMLEGLSVMMERLTQHYDSPGSHHFHSPHNQCCQHAAARPCCHHNRGPREVPGCHRHGARERCDSHSHDPRRPSDLHHRDQRGPPHPDSRHKDPTGHSGCPCSSHLELPQCQQCCQHAAAPPWCHHDHGPREVPGCHRHGARERCASHCHDPRGTSDLHHRGQRGPPHPGSRREDPKGHSDCSCSSHPELPQCQESSDDEDYGASSSEPPSSWRTCDVCYDSYNMSRRRPTILMCGHTFCRQCLGEIAVRGPLRCPTCNAYERRPSAALPPNVVLMAALEKESPSANQRRRQGRQGSTGQQETSQQHHNTVSSHFFPSEPLLGPSMFTPFAWLEDIESGGGFTSSDTFSTLDGPGVKRSSASTNLSMARKSPPRFEEVVKKL